jgi:hypothetical protein
MLDVGEQLHGVRFELDPSAQSSVQWQALVKSVPQKEAYFSTI